MNKLHLAVRNQTLDELANLLKDEDAKTMLGGVRAIKKKVYIYSELNRLR